MDHLLAFHPNIAEEVPKSVFRDRLLSFPESASILSKGTTELSSSRPARFCLLFLQSKVAEEIKKKICRETLDPSTCHLRICATAHAPIRRFQNRRFHCMPQSLSRGQHWGIRPWCLSKKLLVYQWIFTAQRTRHLAPSEGCDETGNPSILFLNIRTNHYKPNSSRFNTAICHPDHLWMHCLRCFLLIPDDLFKALFYPMCCLFHIPINLVTKASEEELPKSDGDFFFPLYKVSCSWPGRSAFSFQQTAT